MTLNACSSVKKTSAVVVASCPAITACQLRHYDIFQNADLVNALIQVEEDYAHCAAKVDVIVQCQRGRHAKTD